MTVGISYSTTNQGTKQLAFTLMVASQKLELYIADTDHTSHVCLHFLFSLVHHPEYPFLEEY
jgi:hypothetical protein